MTSIVDVSTYGSLRGKDLFSRNVYQAAKASAAASSVEVSQNFYGITAPDTAHTANTPFRLAKITAAEVTADGFAGRIDISTNNGNGADDAVANDKSVVANVAQLSQAEARFMATNMNFVGTQFKSDFGSTFSAAIAKGTAQGGADSTNLTLETGAGKAAVALKASDARLLVDAANTDLAGALTVQGGAQNWYQGPAGSGKVSAAGQKYNYVEDTNLSTYSGVYQFNLDPHNKAGDNMTSSAYQFNSFTDSQTTEEVISIGSLAAAGKQPVKITGDVAIGQAVNSAYKLAVAGASKFTGDGEFTGDLTVGGDLVVTGTTSLIHTQDITVADKTILLADGAGTEALLDGAGLTIGTDGTNPLHHLLYSKDLGAWETDVNFDVLATKAYLIAGGYTNTDGATFSSAGALWQADASKVQLGADASLTKTVLDQSGISFANADATIKFGSAVTLGKDGLSSTDPSYGLFVGPAKNFKIAFEIVGGIETLVISHDDNADGNYSKKFLVSA